MAADTNESTSCGFRGLAKAYVGPLRRSHVKVVAPNQPGMLSGVTIVEAIANLRDRWDSKTHTLVTLEQEVGADSPEPSTADLYGMTTSILGQRHR